MIRRRRIWRALGERYDQANIVEFNYFGGGSVMVWGGISINGRTDLIVIAGGSLTARRYRDEILTPVVTQYAGAIGNAFIFMQDNAQPHTARICI